MDAHMMRIWDQLKLADYILMEVMIVSLQLPSLV